MFTGHSGPVAAGAFTPDGKTIISCGGEGDASLCCWNPKTGECTSTLQGHTFHADALTCMGVHREGALVITGAQDGSVRVSNISSNRVLASPEGEGRIEEGGVAVGQEGKRRWDDMLCWRVRRYRGVRWSRGRVDEDERSG